MDYQTIAIIGGAILGLLGATWTGWTAKKGQIKKKFKQIAELLTTAADALEDDKLTTEEIKLIVEKAKALLSFNKEETDA